MASRCRTSSTRLTERPSVSLTRRNSTTEERLESRYSSSPAATRSYSRTESGRTSRHRQRRLARSSAKTATATAAKSARFRPNVVAVTRSLRDKFPQDPRAENPQAQLAAQALKAERLRAGFGLFRYQGLNP